MLKGLHLAIKARAAGVRSVGISRTGTFDIGIRNKKFEGTVGLGMVNSSFREYVNEYGSPWSDEAMRHPIWGFAIKGKW